MKAWPTRADTKLDVLATDCQDYDVVGGWWCQAMAYAGIAVLAAVGATA